MDRYMRGALHHLGIAVLLCGLFQTVPSAHAQALSGAWTGSLSTPQGPLPLEFDLNAGGGGTIKSPSQNNFTTPLQYSSNGNQLTIQVPSVNGTFRGTVSGNQASGTWTQNGATLPLTLSKSGAAGANPGASNGAAGGGGGGGGADVWTGSLSTPQGPLPLEFDLNAGGGGTIKSPSQNNFTAPLQYSSSGNQLTIQVPSVNGTFSGTVSGNQASGTWTQNGATLPLTLSKSGAAGANPGASNGAAGGGGGGGGADVWTGSLSTPQGSLPLEFDLNAGGGGTIKSPSQNNFTAPLQYSSSGNQLTIQVPSVNGTFSGTVSGNQASGTWTQNGATLPLTLSKQP